MSSLTSFERKLRPFTIPNLTQLLAILMGVVYVVGFAVPQLANALALVPAGILEGEVWRILTFVAVIDAGHGGFQVLFAFFTIYIFYLTGNTLERHWGQVRYNLYIFFFCGLTVALVMIPPYMGMGVNGPELLWYSNTQLVWIVFLGFAMIMPNMEFLIFFILPVKVKYLAWISAAMAFFLMLMSPLSAGRPIFAAFVTFSLFFGRELYVNIRYGRRKLMERVEMARNEALPQVQSAFHTCATCGKTDISDPKEDFRYCPTCAGQVAYCSEHIFDHEHVND